MLGGAARDPVALLSALRRNSPASLLLDGRGEHGDAWETRVALGARAAWAPSVPVRESLRRLDDRVAERRAVHGSCGTGLAVLVGYEALEGMTPPPGEPPLVAVEVDAVVLFPPRGEPFIAGRREIAEAALEGLDAPSLGRAPAAHSAERVSTTLPREAYLDAVERIRAHIRAGDVYQANLTQRFEVPLAGDPLDVYRRLVAATPAPRSAFIEIGDLAVLSASPETFVDVDAAGGVRTLPIKGTRPRGNGPAEDALLRAELEASEKDRAELTMIVDLERNDLGRVCRTGSIHVPRPIHVRSFPAVHHLVAEVGGCLDPGIPPSRLLESVFPGGSISGAPKIRAMEILRSLEPSPRGYYTGGLFWFGDDGTVRSSVLIRTVVVAGGTASLGAGGGIVADSDPESEWLESCHKARGPAAALGFVPEDAR